MAAGPKTNLDLINDCDAFPYPPSNEYFDQIDHVIHFRVASYPETTLGYMLPSVALTFQHLPNWKLDLDSTPRTLTLEAGADAESRSLAMHKTTAAMRATGHFRILDKWRDELYPIYGPNGDEVLRLERSSSQLFGVVTYGIHMTAYRRDEDGALQVWVPRRSKTKGTFPSMLDNSVAGGISAGEDPWNSLIRESEEEASLPEDVAQNATGVGAVTYFYVSGQNSGGEEGLLQPECQLVYDLDLTGKDVELKPNDSEVEAFEIMNVDQIRAALSAGEFKPNCALVMLDFLVRHGQITQRNEPNFLEIVARLHRKLEFPLAGFPS
jgi:8-oxo-dGTP pyrophosphatase MutT (NUDIX family)